MRLSPPGTAGHINTHSLLYKTTSKVVKGYKTDELLIYPLYHMKKKKKRNAKENRRKQF
ncbi:MAG: hypothetical protein BAJALOKI1v1_1050009 [Promethearchaeota archaeon]|nr:MAG: hypothetical protein BAJALOKI1v1_1050009 [Candidatus Lokiarchaeota archaeon]